MTQKQADEICRNALPFNIYGKIEENELIGVANSIMFYCACMIKKGMDCDIEFKLNFRSKLFDSDEEK